jgi:multidrug transporter EmrE-like cation transporter
MKTLSLYSLAAALYVAGGALMKSSRGLTRLLPTLALVLVFSAGALIQARAMRHQQLGASYVVVLGLEALLAVVAGSVLFGEQVTAKMLTGVIFVVLGIVVLRLS